MKSVNGEEINEELFEKKLNEKLAEISESIEDLKECSYADQILSKLISEYGMIQYHYGAFNALKDRGLK